MQPLYNFTITYMAGKPVKRHTMHAHNPQDDSDWMNTLSLGTISASAYIENLA